MKCKSCRVKLKLYYYHVAGSNYCKTCCLELISDVSEYKVNIKSVERGNF
jgi:hypothetical protein